MEGILYINNTPVPLSAAFEAPMNYSMADVRNPGSRQGSYSKTVTVIGSKEVDILFNHIYEIDIDCQFNPGVKADARAEIDQWTVFTGYARLMQVNREWFQEGERRTYELALTGSLANIFTAMGDGLLTDLDFSEYDHAITKTNQKNSWDTSIIKSGSPYVNFSGGNPTGEGYLWGLIDRGNTNGTNYGVMDMTLGIYLKEYIDKIFSYTNKRYSSAFFGSSAFKHIVIPSNVEKLRVPDSTIQGALVKASSGSSHSFPVSSGSSSPTVHIDDDSTGSNIDPGAQFNTTTYTFSAVTPGYYVFSVNGSFDIEYQPSATCTVSNSPYSGMIRIVKNGSTILNAGQVAPQHSLPLTIIPGDTYSCLLNSGTPVNTPPTYMAVGDTVVVKLFHSVHYFDPNNLSLTGTATLDVTSATLDAILQPVLTEGQTLNVNNTIPQNIKMADFFMSVVKMFHLFIQPDKHDPDLLYIEPRNDFYSAGQNVVWDGIDSDGREIRKLDISQPLEIRPMGELEAKAYKFTYTTDKDFWNETYTKDTGKVYGEYTYEVDNDFMKETKETRVIFSPTPVVQWPASTDRVIPQIVKSDPYVTQYGSMAMGGNIRILYYGGVKSTAQAWTYNSILSGASSETTYPQLGHTDDPVYPTVDLNFGVVVKVYYTASVMSWTSNNLFNAYYLQFIEEITHKDSKVISGYFNLSASDIYALDFRNRYHVGTHWLRLNKVMDFNMSFPSLTKCEFIKIMDAVPFTPQTITFYGGTGTSVGNDPSPALNTQRTASQFIGTDNFCDPSSLGVSITGNNNSVFAGCSNISIVGDSNIVMPGLSNVTMVNTSGVTVTQSNVTYVDGLLQGQKTTADTFFLSI